MKQDATGMSRRGFIGSAAVGLMALGSAAALGGCAPQKDSGSAPSVEDVAWDRESDVVVVGAGGAGCAAAWHALNGGCSAVVLEATDMAGGASWMCDGQLILTGTKLQEELGYGSETPEQFKEFLLFDGENLGLKDELVDNYVDNGAVLYDWLVDDLKVVFPKKAVEKQHYYVDFYDRFASGEADADRIMAESREIGLFVNDGAYHPNVAHIGAAYPHCHYPLYEGTYQWHGHQGAAVMEPLIADIQAKGGELLLNTKGEELIIDGEGRVVGVRATQDGKDINLKANKGVVLACGTWCGNTEMIADYASAFAPFAPTPLGVGCVDGTGIKMGLQAHANLANMNSLWCYHNTSVGKANDFRPLHRGIMVDGVGSRFVGEHKYMSYTGAKAVEETSSGATGDVWYIVDDTVYQQTLSLRDAETANPEAGFSSDPSIDEDQQVVADSIEELAEKINTPYLPLTLQMYNEDVEKGEDRVCLKLMDDCVPLVKPPFRAGKIVSTMVYNHGGLDIDAEGHVLDMNGQVIKGLYSGGRNARSLIEGRYDQGSGLSFPTALIGGMICGKTLASE